MVKAASLIYAVFISAIIGLLCYALVLVYSLNTDLSGHFNMRKQLLLNNQSGQAYLAAHYDQLKSLSPVQLFPEENSIITSFKTNPWGVFTIGSITSSVKGDSVHANFILANKHLKEAPALYARNSDEVLKISGTTYIKGDIFISDRGLKKINIAGNNAPYNPIHMGKVFVSKKVLPKVTPLDLVLPENFQFLNIEDVKDGRFENSFNNDAVLLEVSGMVSDIELKGKIIIRSNDTLTIASSAKLEDVIIEAPKVIFDQNFQGNVQVFASHGTVLASNVNLKYPSCIIISSVSSEKKLVVLEEGSRLEGALALFGNGLASEAKNSVEIQPDAMVKGDVYCDGTLSLYGTVNGSVYASSLLHETNVTRYDNLIFDGRIIQDNTANLFQLPLLEAFSSNEPLFVKKV